MLQKTFQISLRTETKVPVVIGADCAYTAYRPRAVVVNPCECQRPSCHRVQNSVKRILYLREEREKGISIGGEREEKK